MFIITNRTLSRHRTLRAFGKRPNASGPNELRLAEVTKSGRSWRVKPIRDRLSRTEVKSLKSRFGLDLDIDKPWHGSLKIACEVFDRARKENRSILFFVHGYNNDVQDVLNAAIELESLYDVIVVPFTWPANGGGAISGTASYLSDKADARVSAGALNRAIGKIQQFHLMLSQTAQKKYQKLANERHPNNPTEAATLYTRLIEKDCSSKMSLLCHSMGNYVLKHTLATSENATSKLVFDNICLVAADANNHKHSDWIGKLDVRKRVYVVINEDDYALKVSRIKPGQEQQARLGHYTKNLDSSNAHYIDVTNVEHVGSDHGYFKGDAVRKNRELWKVFHDMFRGKIVEHQLQYHADNNSYRF
jgi:esterase/lipase superfamily enzyme